MVNLGTEVLVVNCSLSEYVRVKLYIAAMRITRRGAGRKNTKAVEELEDKYIKATGGRSENPRLV